MIRGKEGKISMSQDVEGGGKVQENVSVFRFNKGAARERKRIEMAVEVHSQNRSNRSSY
jgi:hypothetical protein